MELLCIMAAACGVLGFVIGATKRQALAGGALGALLGPVGLLLVLASKSKGVTCPYCRTVGLDPKASVCRQCRQPLKLP